MKLMPANPPPCNAERGVHTHFPGCLPVHERQLVALVMYLYLACQQSLEYPGFGPFFYLITSNLSVLKDSCVAGRDPNFPLLLLPSHFSRVRLCATP